MDKAKIALEAKLDGKYLISTSDEYLSTEDVGLGYKQLHEIKRVNRDLKHTVGVRLAHHRRGDRIKVHVLLCWLALGSAPALLLALSWERQLAGS